jgi:hypothetical protein
LDLELLKNAALSSRKSEPYGWFYGGGGDEVVAELEQMVFFFFFGFCYQSLG